MNPVKTPESSPDVVTVDNDSSEESLNKTMGHMSIVVSRLIDCNASVKLWVTGTWE